MKKRFVTHGYAEQHIRAAFLLNVLFTIIVFGGGIITGSQSVMTESVHNLGCTLSLGIAWFMQIMSGRAPSDTYNFGYSRHAIIGALINGAVIIAGSLVMLLHAFRSLSNSAHVDVHAGGMFLLAVAGIVFKGTSMLLTRKAHGANEKMVSLHMLSDTMSWIAVLVVSGVMLFADVPQLDAILSILIAIFILYGAVRGLWNALRVLLDACPIWIDRGVVRDKLSAVDGIDSVDQLIVWSQDGEKVSCIARLVVAAGVSIDVAREQAAEILTSVGIDTPYFDIKTNNP